MATKAACVPVSAMAQIRLPAINPDTVPAGPKELPGTEFDRIQPLRVFTLAFGIAIGENMSAVDMHDCAHLSPCIAWQSRMTDRMINYGVHPITD